MPYPICASQYGSRQETERLAVAAELAEMRALGLRPAPRRYLAEAQTAQSSAASPPAWPILITVAFQLVLILGWVVAR